MSQHRAEEILSGILGPRWETGDEVREQMRRDRSGLVATGQPLGIASPNSTEETARVLRVANDHGIPVVTRGAGTGLAGGATAGEGEIVLSMLGMDRILDIDPVDQVARVEAGVINADLDRAAATKRLRYAPDPASRAISTIGGNIATNAGGLLCAKYGVTREAVLALTAVLADGTILRTGSRTLKGVTGYDLTALLVGSEGTLAVITEATLRLIPRPGASPVTLGAVIPSIDAALDLCEAIQSEEQRPALLELMDPRSAAAVTAYLGPERLPAPFPPLDTDRPYAIVIAQWDENGARDVAERVGRIAQGLGGRALAVVGEAAGEELLDVRRAMNPALPSGTDVLIEDICVPRSKLRDMYAEIARVERETGLEIPAAAHAGDGNLHPHLAVRAEDRTPGGDVPDRVWAAADDLFRAAVRLGGTLSGEHGIGTLKRRWIADELGFESERLQRGIRTLFDPEGVLNPGKVFETKVP